MHQTDLSAEASAKAEADLSPDERRRERITRSRHASRQGVRRSARHGDGPRRALQPLEGSPAQAHALAEAGCRRVVDVGDAGDRSIPPRQRGTT